MRIHQKIGILVTVLAMIITVNPIMALDNSQESINPYVEVYIIDQNKSGFAVDPQVIISLDEYYNMDLTLENLLPKQFTGIITSIEKDDKIIAMKLLLGIYNELDNETKQLVDLYFCRYAEDSQDREVINAFQKITSAKDKSIGLRYTYNRATATTWAKNNYNTRPSDFPDCDGVGGDCANFVSQAMYHGGIGMFDNWYCYKLNNNNPAPQSIDELNSSWSLADPSPWISANQFTSFWNSRCDHTYYYACVDYTSSHTDIYYEDIYVGDAIVFYSSTVWWQTPAHVVIITAYDSTNKDFLSCGHNTNRYNWPLLSVMSGYSYIRFICL